MRTRVRWDRVRWDWAGPGLVAALAFVLRIWDVGRPNRLIFDETYYAKDAYSLLRFGYVKDFVAGANDRIADGRLDGLFVDRPSWIVHPDGGKWVISGGEWLFGMNSFGWRISAVVVGSLMVLVLARLTLRLTGSVAIACLAGLLLTFDGLHFVMSRTALLDVFVAFWILCAVHCLVADRDWLETRLARYRPFRPWQLAAGVCFGLALGTKWNAIYVLAVFGVAVVLWEVAARRSVRAVLLAGAPAFFSIVGVALAVYLLVWTPWLFHADLYADRFGQGYGQYSAPWGSYVTDPTGGTFGPVVDAFRSLWHFHVMTYEFHTKDLNDATHPYASNPIGWLVQSRPVAFDAVNDLPAEQCGAAADSSCLREIIAIGNPAVWWTGCVTTLASVVAWVLTRDRRWSVPVLGVASTWLPWFQYDDRPIFSFYAVTTVPFLIVATCLVLDVARRRATGRAGVWSVRAAGGLMLVAVIGLFWFFHPVLTDQLMSYDSWRLRMWFGRQWI